MVVNRMSRQHKPAKKLRLTKRDYSVLRDAQDFGLIVPELIAPYRFAGKGPAAVTSTLRRLYGEPPHYRYLRPEPLDARRTYYRLTARGAKVIGADRTTLRRLGSQSLARRYALAWLLCVERPHRRRLLDRGSLEELLPEIGRAPKQGYYLEEGEPTRVGHSLVDLGADPVRIVRRALRVAERLVGHPATAPLVAKGRLTLAVLTFDERKRETLDEAIRLRFARQLRASLWHLGREARVSLETYCVPGLAPLILRDFD